jgi:hypothetical protein
MKHFFIAVSILALSLSGDANAETDSVQGPDGREIHQTSCQSSASDCYKEARATCRGNYQILDSYSKSGGIFADAIPGPIQWYHMTYACGASNGQIARFPHQGGQYYAPRGVYIECGGNGWNRSCGGIY